MFWRHQQHSTGPSAQIRSSSSRRHTNTGLGLGSNHTHNCGVAVANCRKEIPRWPPTGATWIDFGQRSPGAEEDTTHKHRNAGLGNGPSQTVWVHNKSTTGIHVRWVMVHEGRGRTFWVLFQEHHRAHYMGSGSVLKTVARPRIIVHGLPAE